MGRLVQSPRAKMLGNLLCCRVCLLTSTQPSEFTRGLALMTSGADIGGVTCRKSYCEWSKTTFLASTSKGSFPRYDT